MMLAYSLDEFYEKLQSSDSIEEINHELYFRAYSDYSFANELINTFGRDLITNWLNQFLKKDREIALKLFLAIKYFNEDLFRMMCQIGYFEFVSSTKSLGADTIFVGVGGTGKSGQMVAYLFRTANNIPSNKFKYIEDVTEEELKKVKNIVFLDDIIGSGQQFTDFFNKFAASKIQNNKALNLYLISITGTQLGTRNIEQSIPGIKVIVPHKRPIKSYNPNEINVIKKYGNDLWKNPLGWNDSGETIIFFYNVPNNTLPIFWSTSSSKVINKEWTPLKTRATSVGRKTSQKKILHILRQYIVKDKIDAHEFMIVMNIIIEAYAVLKPGDLSSQELFNYAELTSSFFAPYEGDLSNGAIFECLPNVRKGIARILYDQIKTTGSAAEFDDFLNLFKLDEFTHHPDDVFQPDLINLTLSLIETFPAFENLVVDKILTNERSDRLIIHGCYLVLKTRHLNKGLQERTINKLSDYQGNEDNSVRYFSKLLLSKINKSTPDFSDVDLDQVFKLRYFYGSIKILNINNIQRYPH